MLPTNEHKAKEKIRKMSVSQRNVITNYLVREMDKMRKWRKWIVEVQEEKFYE